MPVESFIQKHYLLSRVTSTLLAFGFALIYSRELGVENRSIVAYIFVLSSLIWIGLTSGTTLTLRKLGVNSPLQITASFFSLILVEIIIGIILFILGLLVFSSYKTQIPYPILLFGVAYFLLSGLAMVLIEILIACLKYSWGGYLELTAVLFQYVLYFLIFNLQIFSTAISLLASFALSYLIIATIITSLLRTNLHIKFEFRSPWNFWKLTKGSHSLGISLGLMDRVDKMLIAFFFPLGALAQYTVMSSLISFFRFIPDALSKFLISSKRNYWRDISKKPLIWTLILITLSVLAIFSSQFLILNLLGRDWLLPWTITLVFILQELARGVFQLTGNYKISVGLAQSSHKASLSLVISAIPLSILFSRYLGIVGVPLGFVTSYTGILLYFLWRESNA